MLEELKREDRQLHRKVCRRIAIFSLTLALLAGIGKECIDMFKKDNYFDWWDLLADLWGILEGSIIRIVGFGSITLMLKLLWILT